MSQKDDPFDPKSWTASGGEGGPIYGDEFAYLKDKMDRILRGEFPAPPPKDPEQG